MAGLQNATFISMDYKEVIIPNGSVVYADPPYANTTAYGSKFKIDYDDFWDYMREISKITSYLLAKNTHQMILSVYGKRSC